MYLLTCFRAALRQYNTVWKRLCSMQRFGIPKLILTWGVPPKSPPKSSSKIKLLHSAQALAAMQKSPTIVVLKIPSTWQTVSITSAFQESAIHRPETAECNRAYSCRSATDRKPPFCGAGLPVRQR